jgi:hypothetical protein
VAHLVCLAFLDQPGAFDRDEYLYIDAAHAAPDGNVVIAAAIDDVVSR